MSFAKGDPVQYRNQQNVTGIVQQTPNAKLDGYVVRWSQSAAVVRGVEAEFVEEKDLRLIAQWDRLDDVKETFRHRANPQSEWIDGLPSFEIERQANAFKGAI